MKYVRTNRYFWGLTKIHGRWCNGGKIDWIGGTQDRKPGQGLRANYSTARLAVLQQIIVYVILWNTSIPKEALNSCEPISVPFIATL